MTRHAINITRRLMTALLLLAAIAVASPDASAQRRITPVENPSTPVKKKEIKEEFDRSRLAERRDAAGNIVLIDTVTGTEFIDSTAIAAKKGNIYPLLNGVTVGVDVWDPVMRILGQQYGGIGFWGEVSLHNRFMPVFEFGLSSASISPDAMNYTYHSSLAPYFKLGLNYNVFYNSNPDYQLRVGLRYGFTPFSYTVEGVTTSSGDYWGDTAPVNFPSQSTTAGYFEFVLSIKVKIIRNISLGWSAKYHSIAHGGKTPIGESMYIPGFGKRGNALTGAFSVMYTLPLNKKSIPAVDNQEGND